MGNDRERPSVPWTRGARKRLGFPRRSIVRVRTQGDARNRNSPANAAGFRVGDILLKANDEELLYPESLDVMLHTVQPGSAVNFQVRRGDTALAVQVRTAARVGSKGKAPEVLYILDPQRSRARWRTDPDGLRLVGSASDAPFKVAGVEVGSLIESINRQTVLTARGLLKRLHALEPGAEIAVTYIDRSGTRKVAEVTLFEAETRVTEASVPILFHYESELDGYGSKFVLLDLWILSLFRYERNAGEREWTLLSLFTFSSGRGELER